MPQDLVAYGRFEHSAPTDLTRQWVGGIALAAAVGLGYFLAAAFSVRLVLEPEGVAVFWPAAGLSSGLLIALGHAAQAQGDARPERVLDDDWLFSQA